MSDESSKPREFWIYKSMPGTFHVQTEAPEFTKADFHVIEKSAHDAALARIAELEKEVQRIKLLEEVCAIYEAALLRLKVRIIEPAKPHTDDIKASKTIIEQALASAQEALQQIEELNK